MKVVVLILAVFISQNIWAQIDLKKLENDYFSENQNFKSKESIKGQNAIYLKKDSLIYSASSSGITNWYSCSDSTVSLLALGNEIKVSIQSSNNSCFGLSLDNQNLDGFKFLKIKSRFETKLPMDSLIIKLSLVDKNKNQTGFIYQTILNRAGLSQNRLPISLPINSGFKLELKAISSIVFQVVSTSDDPFWGGFYIESITIEN